MKTALITGVTGQDGAYLSDFLLEKGYVVHGIKRRSSSFNTERINHLYREPQDQLSKFHLHYGDLSDSTNIIRIIQEVQPDEIYNLGAQSHVKVSFETPEYTSNVDGIGILRILEAIRILKLENKTKVFQSSTSEMYGLTNIVPQNESTPFSPRSPYAIAKLFAYWMTINYRQAYGIFASNGILFNHESPLRGETFVSRKITLGVVSIVKGKQKTLFLGNLDAKRDWGHTKDYVEAMWRILQYEVPDDFVLATGESISVRDFTKKAFSVLGVEIQFEGKGELECGFIYRINNNELNCLKIGQKVIEIDVRYFRPTEVDFLVGDSTKARQKLGWVSQIKIDELIREMVLTDFKKYK
jgi:GDPmannose 4,6-dehydratase